MSVFVELCFGAEIDIADFASAAGVAADVMTSSCWPLRALLAAVRLDAHVIAQRSALKDVVPGRNVQDGNLMSAKCSSIDHLLPVVVVVGMRQPVEKIWRERRSKSAPPLAARN